MNAHEHSQRHYAFSLFGRYAGRISDGLLIPAPLGKYYDAPVFCRRMPFRPHRALGRAAASDTALRLAVINADARRGRWSSPGLA